MTFPSSPIDPVDAPKEKSRRWRYRKRNSTKRNSFEWLIILGAAFLAALIIRGLLFQAFYIPSSSMENTLMIGDRVLVNKVSYHMHSVHRGDIVVFQKPKTAQAQRCYSEPGIQDLIKRVIGLPGDKIEMSDGTVQINGARLVEPYIRAGSAPGDAIPQQVIPQGSVFVMGDNREVSRDSRCAGPIPKKDIVGRAFIIMWPPSSLKIL